MQRIVKTSYYFPVNKHSRHIFEVGMQIGLSALQFLKYKNIQANFLLRN